jgi:protein gp37
MADLFGEWVPDEWIESVLNQVSVHSKWNYLFLTKNPERLVNIYWPANAWVGATVDTQARVARTEEAFRKIKAEVKWVSCEPLREKVTFTSLELFDYIAIGAQTGPRERQPDWRWVESLQWQARKARCGIFWKSNLTVRPREFPGCAGKPRFSAEELPATVTVIESTQTEEVKR